MKFLALFALFTVAFGAKTGADLENYSFEQFVEDFHLQYSASELPQRRELFHAELTRVKSHNAKGLSWTEAINKYSAMTKGEKLGLFGRSKNVKAATERASLKYAYEVPDDFQMIEAQALPQSVDWRKRGVVSAVKDQGHCGSCWAFASTATIESHVALQTGLLFDLSPEQIAMCAPNPNSCGGTGGCEGATSEIAFEYIASTAGQFEEFQYPYISYFGQDYPCNPPNGTAPKAKIGGYVKLPENNYTALMNAVAHHGPIAISVDASTWSSYHSGIYDGCNQANPDIDHAVQLVGYGEDNGQKYWLVRNSWSASWGEAGYIRLARSDSDETKCGTDTTPQDGSACAGQTQPVKVCGTCGILYDSSFPTKSSV